MNKNTMKATFIEITGLNKDNHKSFRASFLGSTSPENCNFNNSGTISITRFDDVVIADPSYVPTYEGTYDVTPKVIQQTLETENKKMLDNVTIKQIPYYEVSNIYDGKTIYIGSDLNDG